MVFITFYLGTKMIGQFKGVGLIPPSVGDKVPVEGKKYVATDRSVEYGPDDKPFTHFKVLVE